MEHIFKQSHSRNWSARKDKDPAVWYESGSRCNLLNFLTQWSTDWYSDADIRPLITIQYISNHTSNYTNQNSQTDFNVFLITGNSETLGKLRVTRHFPQDHLVTWWGPVPTMNNFQNNIAQSYDAWRKPWPRSENPLQLVRWQFAFWFHSRHSSNPSYGMWRL